jgi:penicillin-binding protein 2
MEGNRKYIIRFVFLLTGLIFAGRLFSIQILENRYKTAAEQNAVRRIVQYPHRGQIYDRYGKLLVYNTPVFDLEVIPKEVKNLDTLALCRMLSVSRSYFDSVLTLARHYSPRQPSLFLPQLSTVDYARIQDRLMDFPGFHTVNRTVRAYPHRSLANALGYIGEISKSQMGRQTEKYYQQGDYVGISGLESFYEPYLRGKRGVKYVMYDVHGVEKGAYKNGGWDSTSVAGENLVSTIDLDLQQYAEWLLANKRGTVVAIEPATGEILAMVSAPSYNPNLLAGRAFSKNFSGLQQDPLLPLFNRSLMSAYPPGSFFKIIQALIGLQEGVITPETAFTVGTSPMKDHVPPGVHNDLHAAIQWSSNTYFYQTFKRIILKEETGNPFKDAAKGYDRWRENVLTFGAGDRLGIDLPNEQRGIVKKSIYFDKLYGKDRWKFSNIYSMSIGQGELGVVPIQMANLAALVANRGYYYTPHLIRSVGKTGKPLPPYQIRHQTVARPEHYQVIVDGMADVVARGTVWSAARLDSIEQCGKTSTVQNAQGKDHAAFIGFAPKENPRIAIAVFLENAGWGGSEAAPIASLIMERYLKGTTQRKNLEKWMQEKNFIPDDLKPLPPDSVRRDSTLYRIVRQGPKDSNYRKVSSH